MTAKEDAMARHISRRKALKTGLATAGIAGGTTFTAAKAHAKTDCLSGKEFWDPGPDMNLKRDLTPGPTPIRIGGGLNLSLGPGESVRDLVKRGYSGCVTGPDGIHALNASQLAEFNAALKEHDVVVYEVAGYRNMIDPDETKRQANLKHLASALEAAEKVNCPMVGTCTGSRDPKYYIGIHPENWTEKTWQITVDAVRQVLKDTAGLKAALGMEAQITMNIDGPKAHRRLMDDVGDKRCAVNLDPVNMCSLANYYHTTELINECFDLLGEDILGCHAKDTYIWPDKQTVHVQEVCAGRGVMDYETYLVRISRLKWPRTLLPEHVPGDQLIEAAGYIRKVAAKVGVKIYGES